LGAKKDRGTGFSVFCPREKWSESQKPKEGGGGGEGFELLLNELSLKKEKLIIQLSPCQNAFTTGYIKT